MNRSILAIILALCSSYAHAGPTLDKFKKDVSAYLAAQAANPNRVIKYSDEQGKLARAALNPVRMQLAVAETFGEINGPEQLKAALDLYKPVAASYADAFQQLPGKYDEEYLDSFDVMYQMSVAGMKPLQNIKLEEIGDESIRPMLAAAIKMASALPGLLIAMLEKNVEQGQFSSSFVPVVTARIQALRAASNPAALPSPP